MQPIHIRPGNKKNAYTITYGSVSALIVFLFLTLSFPSAAMSFFLLVIASVVGIALGLAKIIEPDISFVFDDNGITYNHHKGHVSADWQFIHRAGVPEIDKGQNTEELPFLGVLLSNTDVILDTISPRLASAWLTEQRSVLTQAMVQGRECTSCDMEGLFNVNDFHSESGKTYTGLKAMLGHRMVEMKKRLGYHILISQGSLDCAPHLFAKNLNQLILQHRP